jgi:predicted ester cyclase
MPGFISDTPLARELIRIGDEAIAREDDAALRSYFAEDYVFHGPGGDLSFDELRAYFASLRGAFSNLRIVREQIIVDANFLAARNTFSGDFTDAFTYSPIGPVEPRGQHVEWEAINTFRYHDDGRLAEEWAQTDYRSFLTKLGVTTTESAQQGTHAQTLRDLITHFFNAHRPRWRRRTSPRTSGGRAARSAPSRDATPINR